MTQKVVQAAFLSPAPLWSSRWETHTSQLLHFPNYFSPTLTLTSCFQKGKREDLESKARRNGFYSPSSPPTGGYCLLPSLGFLREVGGDKGKGASRYSRKIEKKEMVLRKSYFLIYMIRWQMNWARLKICFLETFNINFILEKKNMAPWEFTFFKTFFGNLGAVQRLVRTLCFFSRGCGFDPWSGTKIPQAFKTCFKRCVLNPCSKIFGSF